MINSKLVSDFEYLREHCMLLRQNYNTYTDLYNENNRDLLNKVAPTFFTDIAEIMHRDWVLQACKLMDPAKSNVGGKKLENLTIKLINEQLKTSNLFNSLIHETSKKILEYGEKIKPARHKRLAHLDREHHINDITLGETTEEDLSSFLSNIQIYCDEVGIVIGIGPLDFRASGCKGDVLDLLNYLRGYK